jgi:hypothetical protein
MTREEFDKVAQTLPKLASFDPRARIVHVEPITSEYFRNNDRQRCIVEKEGKLYVADYD